MELITILNRCHRFPGFVYQHAHFSADKKSIEVAARPRRGSAAVCERCFLCLRDANRYLARSCGRIVNVDSIHMSFDRAE
jgi:hypothetical protein